MNAHKKINNMLADFALGQLSDRQEAQVKTHLAGCQDCRTALQRAKALLEHTEQIRQSSADQDLCESAIRKVLTTIETTKHSPAFTGRSIWRTIMKNRITKFAAAAVIVIAVLGTIHHFTGSIDGASVAWAIEQTIEAVSRMDSLYISGTVIDKEGIPRRIQIWAKGNKNRTSSGDCRWEQDNGTISLAIEDHNITYNYDPNNNTVCISDGLWARIGIWGNDIGDCIQKFKQLGEWEETFAKDENGRDCVFVKCRRLSQPSSYWVQIDLGTMLPIQCKEWKNANFEGMPWLHAENIVLNPEMPEGIFEFEIPEGAKIIDKRK